MAPPEQLPSRYAAADELPCTGSAWGSSTVTEILMKNEGSYGGHHHPSAPHAAPRWLYPQSTRTASCPKP